MAGETSVSEATRSGRRVATSRLTSPPREFPSRWTGSPAAAPGRGDDVLEDVDDRGDVPADRVAPAQRGPGAAEAGQVQRPSLEPDGEQRGEVGPVGRGTAEAVHVQGPFARGLRPDGSTGPVHGVWRTNTSPPRTGSASPGHGGRSRRHAGQRSGGQRGVGHRARR